MADRKDFLVQEVALLGSSGTQIGRTIKIANCSHVSVGLVVTVTAATLQATFGMGGTNDENRAADQAIALPIVNSGTASVLASGITFSSTTGLLTFNNLGIGTTEAVLTFTSFPRYARPLWTFTSGGGTVSVAATICAWSS
jgi:hypothetical protein